MRTAIEPMRETGTTVKGFLRKHRGWDDETAITIRANQRFRYGSFIQPHERSIEERAQQVEQMQREGVIEV